MGLWHVVQKLSPFLFYDVWFTEEMMMMCSVRQWVVTSRVVASRIVPKESMHLQVLTVKMLNVKTIIVSKSMSHCAGTVHMREESERGIRK